jgi:chromate transporter
MPQTDTPDPSSGAPSEVSSGGPTPPRMLTFTEALETWVLVAAQSFGGPAGQIAVMHRVWVEERRWLSEERFLHALNTVMLLPGPEAQQLAAYVGWLSHGVRGGLCAGGLFVLPGFLSILALSAVYVRFHQIPVAEAALLGLKAAVLAVVADAMIRIGRRVLTRPATMLVALAAFVALFALAVPFPVVILAAGLLGATLRRWFPPPDPPTARDLGLARPVLDDLLDAGMLPHAAPRPGRDLRTAAVIVALWLAPTVALWAALGPDATWTRVATLFSTAAAVSFGGAYAVLAYVAQQAVEAHAWLTPGEMLDGLGLAETTPGPLIQVVQYVGFLATYRDPGRMPPIVAGALGSVLTTWVTFGPSFLFALAAGPYVERIRGSDLLASALRAITAAVVGVIANLAVWLALHTVFADVTDRPVLGWVVLPVPDLSTVRWTVVGIGLASAVALIGLRLPMLPVLAVSTAVGFVVGWGFG